jgi:hypothetical protein
MRTDRQTDMTKLTVAFRNFANASKKGSQAKQKSKLSRCSVQYYLSIRSEQITAESDRVTAPVAFSHILVNPLTGQCNVAQIVT